MEEKKGVKTYKVVILVLVSIFVTAILTTFTMLFVSASLIGASSSNPLSNVEITEESTDISKCN